MTPPQTGLAPGPAFPRSGEDEPGIHGIAQEVAQEGNRGARFDRPLDTKELAFYEAVATNDSAVMRRDVKTDWTVRDDVRAKLRSSINLHSMKA